MSGPPWRIKIWLLYKLATAYWSAWWLVRKAKAELRIKPDARKAEALIYLETALASCRQLFKMAIKKELGL